MRLGILAAVIVGALALPYLVPEDYRNTGPLLPAVAVHPVSLAYRAALACAERWRGGGAPGAFAVDGSGYRSLDRDRLLSEVKSCVEWVRFIPPLLSRHHSLSAAESAWIDAAEGRYTRAVDQMQATAERLPPVAVDLRDRAGTYWNYATRLAADSEDTALRVRTLEAAVAAHRSDPYYQAVVAERLTETAAYYGPAFRDEESARSYALNLLEGNFFKERFDFEVQLGGAYVEAGRVVDAEALVAEIRSWFDLGRGRQQELEAIRVREDSEPLLEGEWTALLPEASPPYYVAEASPPTPLPVVGPMSVSYFDAALALLDFQIAKVRGRSDVALIATDSLLERYTGPQALAGPATLTQREVATALDAVGRCEDIPALLAIRYIDWDQLEPSNILPGAVYAQSACEAASLLGEVERAEAACSTFAAEWAALDGNVRNDIRFLYSREMPAIPETLSCFASHS